MSEEKEFEGTIDASILKDVLSALTAVVDEGVLRFSEEGVTSKSTDPANVAMVIFKLLSSAFTEYSITEPKEIGINPQTMTENWHITWDSKRKTCPSDCKKLGYGYKWNETVGSCLCTMRLS